MKSRNKVLSFICTIAILMTVVQLMPFSVCAVSKGPVSYYGQMQANGNKIIGSKTNNPMQVKGMSFFWSNWSTHMYSSTNVDRMVDEFKCEMIRCPFGVDDNGNPYSPSDEAKYREVIETFMLLSTGILMEHIIMLMQLKIFSPEWLVITVNMTMLFLKCSMNLQTLHGQR